MVPKQGQTRNPKREPESLQPNVDLCTKGPSTTLDLLEQVWHCTKCSHTTTDLFGLSLSVHSCPKYSSCQFIFISLSPTSGDTRLADSSSDLPGPTPKSFMNSCNCHAFPSWYYKMKSREIPEADLAFLHFRFFFLIFLFQQAVQTLRVKAGILFWSLFHILLRLSGTGREGQLQTTTLQD